MSNDDLSVPDFLLVKNRQPLNEEAQARLAATMASIPDKERHQRELRALQDADRRERNHHRALVRKARAEAPPPSTRMPLMGKAAWRAIMRPAGPREQALREQREAHAASAVAKPKTAQIAPSLTQEFGMAKRPRKTAAEAAEAAAAKTPKSKVVKAAKAAEKPKRTKKATEATEVRAGSKLETIVSMLKRPQGCTTTEVLEATGWPSVSMPQQARQAGLTLRKEKTEDGVTRYKAA